MGLSLQGLLDLGNVVDGWTVDEVVVVDVVVDYNISG